MRLDGQDYVQSEPGVDPETETGSARSSLRLHPVAILPCAGRGGSSRLGCAS
jgi:hypothetical protein